jgi:hydroxyacylglutathione hydrolase
VDDKAGKAAAVDPFDVGKVKAAAEKLGVEITSAITTHHHFDHSGGNNDFASSYPGLPIYGGSEKVEALSKLVKDKDEFTIGDNIHVRCLATPCHTQDSICYYVTDKSDPSSHPGGVFTGDTLFIAGCGRFFEGTGDEMDKALSYLTTLPDKTIVYNGHEYTKGSLAFGLSVDPDNKALHRLKDITEKNKITTGLTTIKDEKEWNVFIRLDEEVTRKAAKVDNSASRTNVIDALRTMKNNFRG